VSCGVLRRRTGVTSSAQEDAVTDTRDDRPLVLRSSDDGVLRLTLNREERFNPHYGLIVRDALLCRVPSS
jgi:hypothetical protein